MVGGACGCCNVGAFTEAVTVLTVGVGVCPAVTTDANVAETATGAATVATDDDTAGPFSCVDDVFSATVDCAGPAEDCTGAGLVTTVPGADAAGGCVLAAADARDVAD